MPFIYSLKIGKPNGFPEKSQVRYSVMQNQSETPGGTVGF